MVFCYSSPDGWRHLSFLHLCDIYPGEEINKHIFTPCFSSQGPDCVSSGVDLLFTKDKKWEKGFWQCEHKTHTDQMLSSQSPEFISVNVIKAQLS